MEKQEIQKVIANNIRNLMNREDVSNPELARRCKISSGTVSKITQGSTGVTVSMILTIAEGLGVDVSEVLNGLISQDAVKKNTKKISATIEQLFIGVMSINNKRITCVKNEKGEIIGTSELEGVLDLTETSSSLLNLIQEAIFEALPPNMRNTNTFKNTNLKLVTQSYEFEDTRHKFVLFAKRHFKDVLLISDWQLTYLTDFKDEHGITLVIDKGVSLSYMSNGSLKKIGGWKFPVYDLGGENWLGDETIKHTIEASESYIPMTKLAHTVLSKFNGKIERITETCFKSSNPDIYSLFAEPLLRCYYMGDEAAKTIVDSGFKFIQRTIDVADKKVGKKLKISVNGSLIDLYKPYFEQGRLIEGHSDADKVKLLTDITEEYLEEHGVRNSSSD